MSVQAPAQLKPDSELSPYAQRTIEIMKSGPTAGAENVIRTLDESPMLLQAWAPFAGYFLHASTFPAREREMALLRLGWVRRCAYEYAHHRLVAEKVGVSDVEIDRAHIALDASGRTEQERVTLQAVDELLNGEQALSGATLAALSAYFDRKQILDLIMTIGHYDMLCKALKSYRTPLEDGVRASLPADWPG